MNESSLSNLIVRIVRLIMQQMKIMCANKQQTCEATTLRRRAEGNNDKQNQNGRPHPWQMIISLVKIISFS